MPKTIELNENLRWLELRYKILGKLLIWGNRRLPFIFLYYGYLDGKKVWLPKWITLRQSEAIDKKVEDWKRNIKFD